MPRQSHREKIISSGVESVRRHGFASLGVREIVAAAGVPQGSFTNHFRSKEAFGMAVLDRYYENAIGDVIARTVGDRARPPVERITAYFGAITALFSEVDWRYGCLLGNMGLEGSEHSEPIRKRLTEIFVAWTVPFVEALRAAQDDGAVRLDLTAQEIADFLMAAWQGSMLRMKIDRSRDPLDLFRKVVLATVLVS